MHICPLLFLSNTTYTYIIVCSTVILLLAWQIAYIARHTTHTSYTYMYTYIHNIHTRYSREEKRNGYIMRCREGDNMNHLVSV